MVLVSHDLNLASQYCDRILMLKAGALFRLGTPHEVIGVDALRAVYGCDVVDRSSSRIGSAQGHHAELCFDETIRDHM